MASFALASTPVWIHAEPLAHATSRATWPVEASRSVVLIQSRAPSPVDRNFSENLRWQLSELDLGLREVPAASEQTWQELVQQAGQVASRGDTLLVAWITHTPSATIIYLFDPKGPHLYARQVAVSDSPAAASEELALIVRSALQARLDGGSLALPEIALPAETPKTTNQASAAHSRAVLPTATSREDQQLAPTIPSWGVDLAGVVTHPFSHGDWQLGVAIRTWLEWQRVRLGVGYTTLSSLEVANERAAIAVYRRPFELFAAIVWSARGFRFLATSMLGLDALQRDTTRVAPALSPRGSNERCLVTVGERLRAEVSLLEPVWLSLAGGVEVPLNPYVFEVASDHQRVTIAETLPIRPSFELGVVFR